MAQFFPAEQQSVVRTGHRVLRDAAPRGLWVRTTAGRTAVCGRLGGREVQRLSSWAGGGSRRARCRTWWLGRRVREEWTRDSQWLLGKEGAGGRHSNCQGRRPRPSLRTGVPASALPSTLRLFLRKSRQLPGAVGGVVSVTPGAVQAEPPRAAFPGSGPRPGLRCRRSPGGDRGDRRLQPSSLRRLSSDCVQSSAFFNAETVPVASQVPAI